MSTKFSQILLLKRWMNVAVIALLVFCTVSLLQSNVYRFNPQYLVDNSILKDKNFSVDVKEITSPKLQVKAYLFEEHSNPIVSVSFMFKQAGSAYDDANLQGMSSLLSGMLTAGAGKYDMKSYHRLLEQKAIDISFSARKDDFSGDLLFIKKDMSLAAQLLNLALTQPQFNSSELQKAIRLKETAVKRKMEQPDTFAYVEAIKKLYGNHPYARNPYGQITHFKKITAKHLQAFLKKHLTLQNLVVGISGDVSEQEAAKLVDEIFKGLPLRYTGKSLPDVNIEFSKAEEHINRSSLQNIGLFFAHGPARLDEDFYPTIVATHILAGSSLNSRIHHKAREAEGLTYGVYGSWGGNDKINFISGEFSSTAENFDRLKQIVQEEWNNLGQSGVTDSEVEQIKNYMLAADALRYADIQNISETLVFMQKEKLGLDFLQKRNSYVQKISVDDVNQAAKKYFTPDNFRLITMGESKKEEK